MPIRVLRIIARLNVGGPAIQATLLSDQLDPARFETLLVVGREDPAEGNHLTLHGRKPPRLIEVSALGRDVRPWRDIAAYRATSRIIREFRPDIVHTHTAKAGLIGRLAAWRHGVPAIVHTFHGHVFSGYFSAAKTAAIVWIERLAALRTHRLLTVSESVRDDILARGIGRPDQFDVVRLGFDLTSFASVAGRTGQLARNLGLPDGARTVGIVARLVPIKAHDVFLDMAARVAAERSDVWFLVVGDGERRAALENRARDLGLAERVRFLGWRSDLAEVYGGLDVVALTSRSEGSPVALIEAMASGRPVVATRVGGVEELVGDCGLLADPDDVDALSRSVLRLLADDDFARTLGERGRARVLRDYDQGRLISEIDALYQRLVATTRQGDEGSAPSARAQEAKSPGEEHGRRRD